MYTLPYDRKDKKANENPVGNNRNLPQSNAAQIDVSI